MSKLTEQQNRYNLEAYWRELKDWHYGSSCRDSLDYAINNGYRLHAISIWLGSGASSLDLPVYIDRGSELREIKDICDNAIIYICPNCNAYTFLDDNEGDSISCYSCLKTAYLDKGVL